MSSLLGDWGLAHLGYPIFTPDGNERPLWEVGDDQPRSQRSRFSSCFSGVFGSITTSGQSMLAFNDLSENPDKAGLVFP